jgi:hypothetical protein
MVDFASNAVSWSRQQAICWCHFQQSTMTDTVQQTLDGVQQMVLPATAALDLSTYGAFLTLYI